MLERKVCLEACFALLQDSIGNDAGIMLKNAIVVCTSMDKVISINRLLYMFMCCLFFVVASLVFFD